MVEEIDEQAKATRPRIGTVLSMEMPRMFLEGDLEFDEQTFVTVHLSDLHVSDKHGFRLPSVRSIQNQNARSVADLLFEDLKALELIGKLDVLIVSGDFVWDGKKNEDFHRAREVIEAILEKTGLGRDRLVMVPGNHDIEWGAGELARATHEHVSRENYDAFSELLRQRRPDQKADLVVIPSRSGSRKLRILELNSTTVEGKAAPGIGYVSSAALDRAGELLQGDDRLNRTEQIKQVITWIVVHHHVFPATSAMQEDAGRKNISVMANADELLYFASRWNVDLILHGHEHQPSVTVACRWPVNRPDELVSPVTVIGVGSIGVHSNYLSPFRRNHYYILYRRPDDIVVRSRCLGDKGVMFGSHGDLFLSR